MTRDTVDLETPPRAATSSRVRAEPFAAAVVFAAFFMQTYPSDPSVTSRGSGAPRSGVPSLARSDLSGRPGGDHRRDRVWDRDRATCGRYAVDILVAHAAETRDREDRVAIVTVMPG